MAFKVVKWLNEGTGEPFFARLFMGLMEMRDAALTSGVGPVELERARLRFDEKLEPVLEALMAARNVMKGITVMIAAHRERLRSGAIVQFQQHAFVVSEGIDAPLRDYTATFLTRIVSALKCTQHVTQQLGLEIGPFFDRPKEYERWVVGLRRDHRELAEYLDAARHGWSERLIDRRGELEHRSWVLGRIDHALDLSTAQPGVRLIEPQIDGLTVSEYIERMGLRAFAFTENVVVYACKCAIKPPLTVMEVDPGARNPQAPIKFRLGMPGLGPVDTTEWILRYSDPGFP